MKILLDEGIDRRLAKYIEGFSVETVAEKGWAGIKNSDLLARAQSEFDVFVTVDRNLSFQQDSPKFTIAVVCIALPSNRLGDLVRLIPNICLALPDAPAGVVTQVSA